MRLQLLDPGTRFRLPDCGKTGTVVSHSPGGTTVRYDGIDHVTITPAFGEPTHFTRTHRPLLISSTAEVLT